MYLYIYILMSLWNTAVDIMSTAVFHSDILQVTLENKRITSKAVQYWQDIVPFSCARFLLTFLKKPVVISVVTNDVTNNEYL